MTGAQASYLKTLCEQAHCPDAFDEDLTKAEASKLIDTMREKAGLAQACRDAGLGFPFTGKRDPARANSSVRARVSRF